MSIAVRALAAVLLITGLALAPPATSEPTAPAVGEDWRLLFAEGELRDGNGTLLSHTGAMIDIGIPSARFSPDGTLLATPGSACGETCASGRGAVRINRPDGTSVVRGAIPDFGARSFAWSPDGSTVAVLGHSFEPGRQEAQLWLVPVDGAAPVRVFDDTLYLRMSEFAGVSWNPVDDRLTFIASEFVDEEGMFYAKPGGSDQVFTVPPAFDATPTRYSGEPVCGDCSRTPGFAEPTWSPDGSRLAVVQTDPFGPFGEQLDPFVGFLDEGALAADELRAAVPTHQLAWSGDGQHLAYGIYDVSGDFYDDVEVVDADTGALTTRVRGVIAPFVDWLPCPGGSCQTWGDPVDPPKVRVTVDGRAAKRKVKVEGSMSNVPIESTVSLQLHKKLTRKGPWKPSARGTASAVEGMFVTSFPRPNAVSCRITATYRDGDTRSVGRDVFSC